MSSYVCMHKNFESTLNGIIEMPRDSFRYYQSILYLKIDMYYEVPIQMLIEGRDCLKRRRENAIARDYGL